MEGSKGLNSNENLKKYWNKSTIKINSKTNKINPKIHVKVKQITKITVKKFAKLKTVKQIN